ncbi:MAG: ABC transporter permease [Gemmatimonadota bacterium]|jgi:phospholipid/cholesterol/gamma-HCH transport system permease protein
MGSVQAVGGVVLSAVGSVGRAGYMAVGAARAVRKGSIWGPHLLGQMARIGVDSLPIALFISAFTGIVLALQASYTFTGAIPLYFVGSLVGKTMILELGPVLTGLALAGRVGANIAAEIGTMKVTEQVDALETLAYDPNAYLIVPRVIAGAVMFPAVVLLASALGVVAGWATAQILLDMSSQAFLKGLRLFFESWDVWFAVIKSVTFGVTVTSVGCFFGLHTSGGAQGVGRSTTQSVVVSSMIILVLDAFWAAVLL